MKINYKLLFLIPFLIIGIIMIILGLRWVFVPEPWMLDEIANVDRLNMSFYDLFNKSPDTLPNYLRQIYRFFGLWVTIIGLFITLFSMPKVSSNP
tara:strand:+ start:2047 stop:2331 length:285 start_codon:yes stop_codon:yes gene_type:complete